MAQSDRVSWRGMSKEQPALVNSKDLILPRQNTFPLKYILFLKADISQHFMKKNQTLFAAKRFKKNQHIL